MWILIFLAFFEEKGFLLDSLPNNLHMIFMNEKNIDTRDSIVCVVNNWENLELRIHTSFDEGRTWRKEFVPRIFFGLGEYFTVMNGENFPYIISRDALHWICRYRNSYVSEEWKDKVKIYGYKRGSKCTGRIINDKHLFFIYQDIPDNTISYSLYSLDLSQKLLEGEFKDAFFMDFDAYEDKIIVLTFSQNSFYYYVSLDGGFTWTEPKEWILKEDSPFEGPRKYQIKTALTPEGNPIIVYCLYKHPFIEGTWPPIGGIYISLASQQKSVRIDQREGQNYVFWPSVATGYFNGKKAIAVSWHETDGTTHDDNTRWDIMVSFSYDGGKSWTEPINLTQTPEISECGAILSRKMHDRIHILFFESLPRRESDMFYRTFLANEIFPIQLKYFSYPEYQSIEEKKGDAFFAEIFPNPAKKYVCIRSIHGMDKVKIFDIRGRLVNIIPVCQKKEIIWSLKDIFGEKVPPGIYFIKAGKVVKKLVVID